MNIYQRAIQLRFKDCHQLPDSLAKIRCPLVPTMLYCVVLLAMLSGCVSPVGQEHPANSNPVISIEDVGNPLSHGEVSDEDVAPNQIHVTGALEELTNTDGSTTAVLQPVGAHVNDEQQGATTIDLGKALALGGASHLQVQMVREKVLQAHAKWDAARSQWLPTLRFGLSFNKHDGRLQATEGNIVKRGRSSFFFGGGAGLGNAPLTGAAGGPPRLMANFSLADAIFDRRIESLRVDSATAQEDHILNETLVMIGSSYVELLKNHGELTNAKMVHEQAQELVQILTRFRDVGAAAEADVDRLQVEAVRWKRAWANAELAVAVASTRMAGHLRMDPTTKFMPADDAVLVWELVELDESLQSWLESAMTGHPSLHREDAQIAAQSEVARKEDWRPWLPSVQVGASAGSFGGGPQTQFDDQGSRSDVDLLAVWELENLGLGVRARRDAAGSRLREANLQRELTQDGISTEIAEAFHQLQSYHRQVVLASQAAEAAASSFRRNVRRIQAGEGLPIELVQALQAYAGTLSEYTQAVAACNMAQLDLLHAAGRGVSAPSSE